VRHAALVVLVAWVVVGTQGLAAEPAVLLGNAHPRLFASADDLQRLRNRTVTDPAWQRRLQVCVTDATSWSVPPRTLTWNEPPRGEGQRLWNLVGAYGLTGDRRYRVAARAWANLLAKCPDSLWPDFGSAHLLVALALYYDWCYQDLDGDERRQIAEVLHRGCRGLSSWLGATQQRLSLSNQFQLRYATLGILALALDDDAELARTALQQARAGFADLERLAGEDGSSCEGVGYGEYGDDFVMRFFDLRKQLLHEDPYRNPWWNQRGLFLLYMTTPRNSWTAHLDPKLGQRSTSTQVDMGDSQRYSWWGPSQQLYGIARETRNPSAQWLADALLAAGADAERSWLNLLRYDETLKPEPPTGLPTLHHFPNLGLVSARSDWSGDESLITFTCGPAYGQVAAKLAKADPGSGHAHALSNAVSIFGAGEWLISYPGYVQRRPDYENTLTVDGRGQLDQPADRGSWNPLPLLDLTSQPLVTRAESTPTFDLITGDAAPCYPQVRRYVRQLLFIKPATLVVVDQIAADTPRDLILRFHAEQRIERCSSQQADGSYLVQGAHAVLRIQPISEPGASAAMESVALQPRHGGSPIPRACLTLKKTGTTWLSTVVFTWGHARAELPPVRCVRTLGGLQVGSGSLVFHFDERSGTFAPEP
jgi:Heparinase II/III-like protein/Domain of unknown function (DUF4962)